jgi:predicted transcriptional regulator
MQEPLENLSAEAQDVFAYLLEQDDNMEVEEIAEGLDGGRLRPGQVADAIRELEAGERIIRAFGGWSIIKG